MPITQSRISDILSAAEAYQTAYHDLATRLELEAQTSPTPFLTQILSLIRGSLAISPYHIATLASERTHLNLTAKSNSRRKERAREKRNTTFYAPAPNAPATLLTNTNLPGVVPTPKLDLPPDFTSAIPSAISAQIYTPPPMSPEDEAEIARLMKELEG